MVEMKSNRGVPILAEDRDVDGKLGRDLPMEGDKRIIHDCEICKYHLTGHNEEGEPWEDCCGDECPDDTLALEWRPWMERT